MPEQKEWLAFADPVVRPASAVAPSTKVRGEVPEAEEATRGLYDRFGMRLEALPYTRQEVEGIRSLYPKDRQRVYLGAEATETRLKQEHLSDYKRIHLATHAVINEEAPGRSGVVLS